MFKVTTSEIRWFIPGSCPQNLLTWIRTGTGMLDDQPERTDVYLVQPESDNLGIKLREGRIEIKKRTADHGAFHSLPHTGTVESWIKWSFESGDPLQPDLPFFDEQRHWIRIRKKRILRKYEIERDGKLVYPPEEGYPERGLAVEVAEIMIKEMPWWSFGLECFGLPNTVYPDLAANLPVILSSFPIKQLDREQSMGYPAWINHTLP